MSLLHALALAFAASAQVEAATHPRAFMTGGRKLTLEDLAEECERRGMSPDDVEHVLSQARIRMDQGEDMHKVYWSLVPSSPVQSFGRPRRDPDPVRPKPTPRYRCPKCEATANTPKRCRACNVKMTSRKR